MTLLFLRSVHIISILTVLIKVALTRTGSDIEKRNSNELKVRAWLRLSDSSITSETGVKQLILTLPSNGDVVYKEIWGQNVEQDSKISFSYNTPHHSHATCFFWRQSNEGIPWQPGLGFVSLPMYPAEDEMVPLYPRAERLYCFDSTVDKVHDEDTSSTVANGESDSSGSMERVRSDNRIGTFTLLFEYRKGQQALIRVRSRPGSNDANLDLSDVDAIASSTISNIEPGINVVRVALVDVPRENSSAVRRKPSCTLWLSPTYRTIVRAGSTANFRPYLNIYRITCFRAAVSSRQITR